VTPPRGFSRLSSVFARNRSPRTASGDLSKPAAAAVVTGESSPPSPSSLLPRPPPLLPGVLVGKLHRRRPLLHDPAPNPRSTRQDGNGGGRASGCDSGSGSSAGRLTAASPLDLAHPASALALDQPASPSLFSLFSAAGDTLYRRRYMSEAYTTEHRFQYAAMHPIIQNKA
jgi:hypothetical protein